MKSTNIRAALLLLTFLAVAQPAGAQQRYSVESIVIEVTVQADGVLEIREALSYDFRGRFTFAFRDIPRGAPEECGWDSRQRGRTRLP